MDGGDHRQVLGLGADAEGDGRVGGRGQKPLAARQRQQVGCMAAAHTLDVVQVHGPAVEDAGGVRGEQRLVEAVSVDGELHVVAVGDVERTAQLLGPGGDVLVDLQARAARDQRLLDALGPRRRCAHQEGDVDRDALERRPGGGEAVGGVRSQVPDGAVVLGDPRRHAPRKRCLGDLGREPVHVRVDRPGGDDEAAGVHDRRLGVEDDLDAVHRVGVAGPPHRADAAATDADRRPAHAQHGVEHEPADDRDVDSSALCPHAESIAVVAAPGRHDLVRPRDVVGLGSHPQVAVAEPGQVTRRHRRTPARGRGRAPPRAPRARPGGRRRGRRGRG